MNQLSLKYLSWNPLKCLMIHLVLSNNDTLSIQKKTNNRSSKNRFLEKPVYGLEKGLIILYVKENFLVKIINSHKFPSAIEIICFKLSICNKKWLLLGTYKLSSQSLVSRKTSQ